jgi:putative membrane protein insertion efficiency factor
VTKHILIFGVRLYQWLVSPVLKVVFGPLARCRFEPTCSVYAIEALRVHGALRGTWLALKRIGRCQPWGSCGHDPVPESKSEVRLPSSNALRTSGNLNFEANPKFEESRVTSPAIEFRVMH